MAEKFSLGEKISSLRNALGISQKELAARAGVGSSTIENLETGKQKNPTLNIVAAIAGALDTDASFFIKEHEEPRPAQSPTLADGIALLQSLEAAGQLQRDLAATILTGALPASIASNPELKSDLAQSLRDLLEKIESEP